MNDVIFFFSGWESLARILIVGASMYVALVFFLRLSGSRTLSSMSAFDFIVTVAIGSAFGRALTAKGVALAEALTAFALLVGLQYVVAWLKTRHPSFMSIVTNPPVLLFSRGQYLRAAMRQQRVTEAELRGIVRKQNIGSMTDVAAIILESSGEFSVIKDVGDASALGDEVRRQL